MFRWDSDAGGGAMDPIPNCPCGSAVMTPYLYALLIRQVRPTTETRTAIEFVIFDSLRHTTAPEALDE